MPKTNWITPSESAARILSRYGLSVDQNYLQDEIDSAVDQWEQLTGFSPFLADANAGTYYYDPPGSFTGDPKTLFFKGGFVSITSVKVGVVTGFTGSALTLNTDFFVKPDDAASRKRPFTRLRFASSQLGPSRSIEVVGKRGFWADIATEVWIAVAKKVEAEIVKASYGTNAQIRRIKQSAVEIEYSTSVAVSLPDSLMAEFKKIAKRYHQFRV